jgi:pimeloyl-ACP methyl ester carboxylesterase
MTTFCSIALGWLVFGLAVSAQAQPLTSGRWPGRMIHPSGDYLDLFFLVDTRGDSMHMTLEVPEFDTFPIHQVSLRGDQLEFWWESSVRLTCSLERQDDRSFQGGCFDAWGGRGPIMMVPPDLSFEAVTIEDDAFFAGWEPPEPLKTRAQLIAEEEVAPATAVDMGGYRLNAVVQGEPEGGYTVVFESGLGDDHGVWKKVLSPVSRRARVFAYDRPGLGYSDADEGSRAPARAAEVLHELLRRASVSPPYVLVGHAEGAWTMRAFAGRYPGEVAGLVLVDPAQEDLGPEWAAADAASWSAYLRRKQDFLSTIPGPMYAEFEVYRQLMTAGEVPDLGALPDVPVAVLTALRPAEAPAWVGETARGVEIKKQAHLRWVGRFANGVHHAATESGPYIQREEPELVAKAIREVLTAARTGRPLRAF